MSKPDYLEDKASSPSIIQSFTIHNLYGYRTISMESPYSATVLIARNGAGKTTLISALFAVLKGQFSRLQALDFSKIRLRLSNLEEEIVIKKSDVDEYLDVPLDGEIAKLSRRIEQDPAAVMRFVT